MPKVLIEDGDIHFITKRFIDAERTLCGKRLHSISTVITRKLHVTCENCIRDMTAEQRAEVLKDMQTELDWFQKIAHQTGFKTSINILTPYAGFKQPYLSFELVPIPDAIIVDPRRKQP